MGCTSSKINHRSKVLTKSKKRIFSPILSGAHNNISHCNHSFNSSSIKVQIFGGSDFVDTYSELMTLNIYVINNHTL